MWTLLVNGRNGYSKRNAETTSMRLACRAGYMPPATPIKAEKMMLPALLASKRG